MSQDSNPAPSVPFPNVILIALAITITTKSTIHSAPRVGPLPVHAGLYALYQAQE